MNNGKGRAVRNNAQEAADILIRHQQNLQDVREGKVDENGQAIQQIYSNEQVDDAASILREHEMAIQQGHGRLNNRQESAKVLTDPKTKAAYDAAMEEGPVVDSDIVNTTGEPITVTRETRGQIVGKIVGDRLAGLNEAQQRAELERMSHEDQNEQQG